MKTFCGLILAVLLVAPAAMVQGGHNQGCTDSGCTDSNCTVQCPRCDHTCKFSVDIGKDAKTCYSSECKPICIPKFVFPWQKKPTCCDTGRCNSCTGGCDSCAEGGCRGETCSTVNNGACVRYVNVLKKFEYECEACKYKWEAIRSCQLGSGCGSCNGTVPTAPAAPAVNQPTPAEDMLPPAPPPITRRAPVSQVRQTSGVLNYYD